MKMFLFIFALWLTPALATVGLVSFGGGNLNTQAPVVQAAIFSPSVAASNGAAVGTATATNAPTSWSITAGDAAGDFAIANTGAITFTVQGAADYDGSLPFKTVTLTLQAVNASGAGTGNVTVNAYADGSVAAVAASQQFSNFFTSRALQSSQTYATRPPWKVAGVDYSVGVPTGTVLKDPAVDTLPSGCTYASNIVTCSGSSSPTFDGWDFSLHTCVELDFLSNVTGTITVKNSNFVNGVGCDTTQFYLLTVDGGAANLVLTNNSIDGGAPALYHVIAFLQFLSSGTLTDSYNAYLRIGGHVVNAATVGNVTTRFNYGEGLCYAPCEQHGEWQILLFSGTMAHFTFNYNTFLQPSAVSQVSLTTTAYISGGNSSIGSTITLADIQNNTFVVNLYNGAVTASAAAVEWAYLSVVTSNVFRNYVDPTGAQFCFVDAGGGGTRTTITFTGNINLRDASTISGTAQSLCHGHG